MSSSPEKKNKLDPLNPTEEEQALRVLQGKCPHNRGWTYFGRYNDDIVYTCNSCGEWQSI